MLADDVEKIYNKLVEWGSLKESQLLLDDLIDEFSTREQKDDPGKTNRQNFRETDPSTSKRASFDHLPRAGSQRKMALNAFLHAYPGGLTQSEVERRTNIQGVWKRISELHQGGWIINSGLRMGPNGSDQQVYIATEKARRATHG